MRSSISVRDALRWGVERLKKAGVPTPVLDAEVLLVHPAILQDCRMGRSWLYAHSGEHVSIETFKHFKELIRRRARREPVAYILGHKEFYGLDFLVNRKVLIPRPETEMLVEQAIRQCKMENEKCKIIDIGTGSGAIVVALATKFKSENIKCRMFATDISAVALRVARQNARRHGVENDITFLKGNLLEPFKNVILNACRRRQAVKDPVRTGKNGIFRAAQNDRLLIVANLSYLPTAEWRVTMPEVRKYEPRGALDGGRDGLKYYRELFRQLRGANDESGTNLRISNSEIRKFESNSEFAPLTILCEICPEQSASFKKMARGYFPSARFEVVKDLAGRNRVVVVRI